MADDDWIGLDKQAIVKLLDEQHAVTLIELEARLADRIYDPRIVNNQIQPRILTTARQQLEDDGEVVPTTALSPGANYFKSLAGMTTENRGWAKRSWLR